MNEEITGYMHLCSDLVNNISDNSNMRIIRSKRALVRKQMKVEYMYIRCLLFWNRTCIGELHVNLLCAIC